MSNRNLRLTRKIIPFVFCLALSGCFELGDTIDNQAASNAPVTPPPSGSSNSAPAISGNPGGTVAVGASYAFQPSASDPDGDTLSFTIRNKPAWADFNAGNGMLTGTPLLGQEGQYSGIAISVSDGAISTALPDFSINVTSSSSQNNAPVISGNPVTTATVGQQYAFAPTAMDPDGDSLSFAVQNLPAWASFSNGSGALTGMPAPGDAGTYSGIVITVSDGSEFASLPAFSISVNQSATGSITLSWDAPQENDDGSPLTDLSGYMVYYGTSSGNYSTSHRIDNAGVTTYVVENLTANSYYVVTTALNSSGAESGYSNEVTVAVN